MQGQGDRLAFIRKVSSELSPWQLSNLCSERTYRIHHRFDEILTHPAEMIHGFKTALTSGPSFNLSPNSGNVIDGGSKRPGRRRATELRLTDPLLARRGVRTDHCSPAPVRWQTGGEADGRARPRPQPPSGPSPARRQPRIALRART